jgi:hypothetical protein
MSGFLVLSAYLAAAKEGQGRSKFQECDDRLGPSVMAAVRFHVVSMSEKTHSLAA